MSGGLGPVARSRIIGAQQMEDVRLLQAKAPIGQEVLVDHKREIDTGLGAKRPRVLHAPKPNSDHAPAARLDLRFVRAQLRDVFAAENSTPVPQEGNHRRLLRP